MSNTKQLAVEILQKIITDKIFFTEAKSLFKLDEHQDISFINMLILSTLRHRCYVRNIIQKHIKKAHKGSPRFVDFALETATTELLFLNTPDYAVLNSYISCIKQKHDKYVANFANAILRAICREKDSLISNKQPKIFPPVFLKLLKQDYTQEQINQIEQSISQTTPLDITAKDIKQVSQIAQQLKGTILPNGSVRIYDSGKISELAGYNDGHWWVQDFAASLPVLALGNIKNKRVLDLCAAPGGKTAQLISKGAFVTALDISSSRLTTLQKNLQRLNLQTDATICTNAIDFLQNFNDRKYDIILLDAPCSASGTIRRHPELIHIKDQNDITKSAKIQKELLELCSKALTPNGILLYTVCSISKTEGEKQIKKFLHNNPDYKLIPILEKELNLYPFSHQAPLTTKEGYIRTLPYYFASIGGMDSFFVAKLQKVK